MMDECVRYGTDFLLFVSIRDVGPLTEVVMAAFKAKQTKSEKKFQNLPFVSPFAEKRVTDTGNALQPW